MKKNCCAANLTCCRFNDVLSRQIEMLMMENNELKDINNKIVEDSVNRTLRIDELELKIKEFSNSNE